MWDFVLCLISRDSRRKTFSNERYLQIMENSDTNVIQMMENSSFVCLVLRIPTNLAWCLAR